MHPRVIAFEGPDLAGKSTQIKVAEQVLIDAGQKVVVLRSPGGSTIAEVIRREVLSNPMPNRVRIQAMLLAFVATAYEKIQPAVADGHWVLLDRWTLSTIMYQGLIPGYDAVGIATLVETTMGSFYHPGTYLLYQVSREVAKDRMALRVDKKPDQFEDEETQARISAAYQFARSFVRGVNTFIMDGNKSVEDSTQETTEVINQLLTNELARTSAQS